LRLRHKALEFNGRLDHGLAQQFIVLEEGEKKRERKEQKI
jgi:hypothetical protein